MPNAVLEDLPDEGNRQPPNRLHSLYGALQMETNNDAGHIHEGINRGPGFLRNDALDDRLSKLMMSAFGVSPAFDAEKVPERIGQLKAAAELFEERNALEVGMLVQWKPGMSDKKKPLYGEPAIVLEVLSQPIYDTEAKCGSPYFRQPLDIILGVLDQNNDLLILHNDSRRFMPVPVTE